MKPFAELCIAVQLTPINSALVALQDLVELTNYGKRNALKCFLLLEAVCNALLLVLLKHDSTSMFKRCLSIELKSLENKSKVKQPHTEGTMPCAEFFVFQALGYCAHEGTPAGAKWHVFGLELNELFFHSNVWDSC